MTCPECRGVIVDPVLPGPEWPVMCRRCFAAVDARSEALEMAWGAVPLPDPVTDTYAGDLTGRRFGAITVVRYARRWKRSAWECRCDCGAEVVVAPYRLLGGRISACLPCARRAEARARSRKIRGVDLFALAQESGINIATIKGRHKLGWPAERLAVPLVRPPMRGAA